jgi:NAD(P)-dependent dehydrogenase (short-subunit alcohol dehydrogenase family)
MEGHGHASEPYDLANVEGVAAWLGDVVKRSGLLDGLVCSAGVSSLRPLRGLDMAHFDNVMRVNCHSAVALTTAFSRKRMLQPQASVVLVASVAGLFGAAGRGAYSASKGALIAFARSAAIELAPAGVRVNCVAPAYVKTEMFEAAMQDISPEKGEELVRATQPLGLGTPLDVAHSVAFLLAGTGRWITGSALAVDGGYAAQ